MKKHILIALSLSLGLTSFAQKKELKMAEKAIKKNNYAEAKSALSKAEGLMSSMDDKLKEKFHLLRGKAFYANGAGNDSDIDQAVESLSKLGSTNQDGNALRQSMVNSFITKATADLETKILAKVSELTGNKVSIENKIDENIIGGFVLRVGDLQYDASIANKLNSLKREFTNSL